MIRITGGNPRDAPHVDFDVKINMMSLIVPEEPINRMNYVKIIGDGEKGFRGDVKETTTPKVSSIDEWAKRYCEDPSTIKEYVLPSVHIRGFTILPP